MTKLEISVGDLIKVKSSLFEENMRYKTKRLSEYSNCENVFLVLEIRENYNECEMSWIVLLCSNGLRDEIFLTHIEEKL